MAEEDLLVHYSVFTCTRLCNKLDFLNIIAHCYYIYNDMSFRKCFFTFLKYCTEPGNEMHAICKYISKENDASCIYFFSLKVIIIIIYNMHD